MPGLWSCAAFCHLLIIQALAGQNLDFDDLARRASAAIDTHPEEAATLYQQALALRPGWADGWLYRGVALYQLGHFGEARDSFRKGVALAPDKGTAVAFLGLAEYELGDYRPALSHILKGEAMGLADSLPLLLKSTVTPHADLSAAFGLSSSSGATDLY